jgi:hypothetical protein
VPPKPRKSRPKPGAKPGAKPGVKPGLKPGATPSAGREPAARRDRPASQADPDAPKSPAVPGAATGAATGPAAGPAPAPAPAPAPGPVAGPVPGSVRGAAVIAAVEGGALLGLGVFYVAKTAVDRPDSYGRALFGASFAVLGGLLLMLLGRGVLLLRGWARTPVVVLQLLCLPVGYSLAFQAGLPGYGGPILVLAVGTLYLLFTPESRNAFWREPPGE